jgi:hypothetical protein
LSAFSKIIVKHQNALYFYPSDDLSGNEIGSGNIGIAYLDPGSTDEVSNHEETIEIDLVELNHLFS